MNDTTLQCPNCQHEVKHQFCPSCGQRRVEGRYTWPEIKQEIYEKGIGLEQGLIKTFIDLTINPGHTVNKYLMGVRKRYSSPFAYYMLALAILIGSMQLVNLQQKAEKMTTQEYEKLYGKPLTELSEKEQKEAQDSMQALSLLWNNMRYVTMALVPFYAIGWLIAAYKQQYSLLETLILSLYINAQVAIFQAIATIPLLWSESITVLYASSIISSLTGFIYNYWALKQFYKTGWIKTSIIYTTGLLFSIIVLSVLGIALGYSYAYFNS